MSLETQPSLFDIYLIFIQISYSCNVQLSITQTNTVYITEIPEDLYVAKDSHSEMFTSRATTLIVWTVFTGFSIILVVFLFVIRPFDI